MIKFNRQNALIDAKRPNTDYFHLVRSKTVVEYLTLRLVVHSDLIILYEYQYTKCNFICQYALEFYIEKSPKIDIMPTIQKSVTAFCPISRQNYSHERRLPYAQKRRKHL